MFGGAEGVSDGVAVPADLMKSFGGPGGASKDVPADNGAPAPKLADLPKFGKPEADKPKPAQSDSASPDGNQESAAQDSGGVAPAADHRAPAPSADPGAASSEAPSPAGGQAPGDGGAPAPSAPTDNGAPAPKPATLDDVVKAIKEGQQPTKKSLGERVMDYAEKRGVAHVEEHFSGGEKLSIGGDAIHTTHEKE
jgi:hypothetical protein